MRPSTCPYPVITPSAGASLPCIATCEKCGWAWMPNSQNVPSSISRSIRSRAVNLSAACCLAIFSSPPPSFAFSRRSARSSTSGRSRLAGFSVVDMRLLEQRFEHAGDGARVIAVDERRHLDTDDLALVGDGLQQVVELVRPQAAGYGELRRHVLGVEHVDVEVDVDRRAIERVLYRDQGVEAGADTGGRAALERNALRGVEIAHPGHDHTLGGERLCAQARVPLTHGAR